MSNKTYNYSNTNTHGWQAARSTAAKVSNDQYEAVRTNIDLEVLRKVCLCEIKDLFALCTDIVGKKGSQYGFMDRGADVLAVSHCDIVSNLQSHFDYANLTDEFLIFCPALDDRLGVYTIMYLLPKLGINVDVLLTENEESGASTGNIFTTKKKYNWMVEFDRRGTDAVTYKYTFKEIEDFFNSGFGSFSDISVMEGLGINAFNVGIGYTQEHTNRCHMILQDYIEQIARFVMFWDKYKDKAFKHKVSKYIPPVTPAAGNYASGYNSDYAGHGYAGGTAHNVTTAKTNTTVVASICEHCNHRSFTHAQPIIDGKRTCPECGLPVEKDKTTDAESVAVGIG